MNPRPIIERILPPVNPNAGIEVQYRNRLIRMLTAMSNAVARDVRSAYRSNPPEILTLTADESPANVMRRTIKSLLVHWTKRFNDAAPRLARWFATQSKLRSDAALKKILIDAGFSVDWNMSRAMNDAMQATIAEQVSLIKSIPSQYFTQIEGMVMRSVTTGRDLKQLTDDLQHAFKVTRRRAELIARDQNNKATSTLTKVRQLSTMGPGAVAIWMHSGGGREPRHTHLKAGRGKVRYLVAEGWHDPDPRVKRKIFPGELINCRCVSRLVVPGFN